MIAKPTRPATQSIQHQHRSTSGASGNGTRGQGIVEHQWERAMNASQETASLQGSNLGHRREPFAPLSSNHGSRRGLDAFPDSGTPPKNSDSGEGRTRAPSSSKGAERAITRATEVRTASGSPPSPLPLPTTFQGSRRCSRKGQRLTDLIHVAIPIVAHIDEALQHVQVEDVELGSSVARPVPMGGWARTQRGGRRSNHRLTCCARAKVSSGHLVTSPMPPSVGMK